MFTCVTRPAGLEESSATKKKDKARSGKDQNVCTEQVVYLQMSGKEESIPYAVFVLTYNSQIVPLLILLSFPELAKLQNYKLLKMNSLTVERVADFLLSI